MMTGSLSSCNGNEKTNLIFGQVYSDEVISITHSDLSGRVNKLESFIVVTTPLSNCTCWNNFRNVLNRYIENYNVAIYYINYSSFYSGTTALDSFGIDFRNDEPTLAIFSKGNLVVNEVYDSKNKIFSVYDDFEKYMDEKVTLPKIYYVNEEQLEQLYAQENDFIIYFGRSLCNDCTYVNRYALPDYVESHSEMKKIYAFDGEEIRTYDDNGTLTNPEEWQAFKDQYGLSEINNPDYGYGEGVVPTFFYVDPDSAGTTSGEVIKSGAVYFNEEISKNSDGTYTVSNSYYSTERTAKLNYLSNFEGTKVLDGLTLDSDSVNDVEGSYYWYQDKAEVYYTPLLNAFFDYYNSSLTDDFII